MNVLQVLGYTHLACLKSMFTLGESLHVQKRKQQYSVCIRDECAIKEMILICYIAVYIA